MTISPGMTMSVLSGDHVGPGGVQAPAGDVSDRDDVTEGSVQVVEMELATLFASARDMRRRAAASIDPCLQPAAYGLLRLLLTHGSMRASVMAELLGVDRSAVSRLLQSLEGLGLTERHPDEVDGRAHLVGLSPLGEQRMRALRTEQQAILREAFRDWTPEDIDRFAGLLGQFNATVGTTRRS